MKSKKVVVIGAGVGGIATAIRLAREGFDVTVLEKNETVGGRLGRMNVDGYRIDTGPTIFLMPHLYESAFACLGTRMQDHLSLKRIDPTYHLNFADGTRLNLTSDMADMSRQMETIEPGSTGRMLQYLREGEDHYRLSVPMMVERDFPHWWNFFHPANLMMFARIRAFLKHSWYVDSFFRDERLRTAFTFQDLYMGLSPQESPASYSLMQYSELATGMWYPEGGMYRVAEVLENLARRAGVVLHYRTPVEKILTAGGRARGAVTADGQFFPADVVVANADLSYVYEKLLPDEAPARRLRRMEYGCSTVMFYWGMDRRIPGLGAHNLILTGDFRDNFRALKDGRIASETPDFYIHVPTRVDPSMAPEGCDMLTIAVPVAHIDDRHPQDFASIRDRMREFVLRRMAQAGYDGLESALRTEISFLPEDWRNRYNLTCGSTHGLSHKMLQMGYFRPHNRHARYRNLFFAGASTHPGTGVPMVLVSARHTAESILREEGWQPAARTESRRILDAARS